jgi:hypothetical protein
VCGDGRALIRVRRLPDIMGLLKYNPIKMVAFQYNDNSPPVLEEESISNAPNIKKIGYDLYGILKTVQDVLGGVGDGM